MSQHNSGADRVGHGEASLGDAQAANAPDDDDMIFDDAPPLDSDVDFEGDGTRSSAEHGNEDPAPSAP
jgi:hypothetical protein